MSVTPLHPNPLVPLVLRDGSGSVLEILGENGFTPDFMLETGYRVCGTCGTWCEPVEVEPDIRCAKCLHHAIEVAVIRGIHLKEDPHELAARIFALVVRPNDPAHQTVS